MIWQDIVLTIGNVLLSYGLIPQVYKNYKEKRNNVSIQTSLIMIFGLGLISFSSFTLKLYAASATIFFSITMWVILLYQSFKYRKYKK